MNFTPFNIGTTFSGALPTAGAVTQFTTAKFASNVSGSAGQVVGLLSSDEAGVTYLRPVDASGFTLNLGHQGAGGGADGAPQIITLPISVAGGKPGEGQQTLQIQVVGGAGGAGGDKYAVPISLQPFTQGNATVLTVAYSSPPQDGSEPSDQPIQLQMAIPQLATAEGGEGTQIGQQSSASTSASTSGSTTSTVSTASQSAGLHSNEIVLPDVKEMGQDDEGDGSSTQAYPVAVVTHIPSELILRPEDGPPIKECKKEKKDSSTTTSEQNQQTGNEHEVVFAADFGSMTSVASSGAATSGTMTWGASSSGNNGGGAGGNGGGASSGSTGPGAGVADYIRGIASNSLPLSLHQYLKFSPETIKREQQIESSPLAGADQTDGQAEHVVDAHMAAHGEDITVKKKYKKKAPKPRKPRPGQVHIAFALDGTTLFCCPECNMAYPEKELLEQHLVAHKIERRFICDICGAGLKRKEHLERHKLGHNPERPYICSVCCKGFKRKEHLNLHFVIHSGEKSEVCPECGKGFHRRDHLRKHARSHVAKRVKEETIVVGEDGQPLDASPVGVATTTMILPHHHPQQSQQQQH